MTDKALISKLNSLKNVNPDANWLKSNRELLLTQISNSGATEISPRSAFIINLQSFFKTASQPAFALAVFILILVSGSLFSHQLFNKTKPNDSLYIARIISEKARLNTIFSQTERDRLAVQFAADHAQDITTVLADPQFNNNDNQEAVAKLSESFKKEINTVKTKMNRLAVAPTETEEEIVSMANTLKDEDGLEIYQKPDIRQNDPNSDLEEEINNEKVVLPDGPAEETIAEEEAEETIETKTDSDKILEEAEELFEQKDYDNVLNKLKEVDEIIK